MTEIWRPVVGCETFYEVSDRGLVRALDRPADDTTRRRFARIMHQEPDKGGYFRVTLSTPTVRKAAFVHTLVLDAFVGPRPDGAVTRHLDGNTANNAASNLAWGTQGENVLDIVAHGNHPMARKTHCPQGHVYDELNTYRGSDGYRHCRTCLKARQGQRVTCIGCGRELNAGYMNEHQKRCPYRNGADHE